MERFQLMMLSINKVVRSGRAHRASAICPVRLDDCFRKSVVVLNPTNAFRRDKIIFAVRLPCGRIPNLKRVCFLILHIDSQRQAFQRTRPLDFSPSMAATVPVLTRRRWTGLFKVVNEK